MLSHDCAKRARVALCCGALVILGSGSACAAHPAAQGKPALRKRHDHQLRVVLPPTLVASTASGQFGGMGQFGGGMNGGFGQGMGGGMGQFGGMPGGGMGQFGGMAGGGMGGMGGGMGRMNGGVGGAGRMPLTMPPQVGMMMVGQVIVTYTGTRASWDTRNLYGGTGMIPGMGPGMGQGQGQGQGMGQGQGFGRGLR